MNAFVVDALFLGGAMLVAVANSHFEKRRRVKLRLRRGATHDLVASSRGRNEGGPRPTANGSMSHTDV